MIHASPLFCFDTFLCLFLITDQNQYHIASLKDRGGGGGVHTKSSALLSF